MSDSKQTEVSRRLVSAAVASICRNSIDFTDKVHAEGYIKFVVHDEDSAESFWIEIDETYWKASKLTSESDHANNMQLESSSNETRNIYLVEIDEILPCNNSVANSNSTNQVKESMSYAEHLADESSITNKNMSSKKNNYDVTPLLTHAISDICWNIFSWNHAIVHVIGYMMFKIDDDLSKQSFMIDIEEVFSKYASQDVTREKEDDEPTKTIDSTCRKSNTDISRSVIATSDSIIEMQSTKSNINPELASLPSVPDKNDDNESSSKTLPVQSIISHLNPKYKAYICPLADCDKSYAHKVSLSWHIRTHTGERPYLCVVCGFNTHTPSNLIDHMKLHTRENAVACSVCDKTFPQKYALKDHMLIHTGEKPHICAICGRSFRLKQALQTHSRTHTGQKPYQCPTCQQHFTDRRTLHIHIKRHNEVRAYTCSVCVRLFTTSSQLVVHQRTHTEERPYPCTKCSKNLFFNTSLFTVYYTETHLN